MMIMNRQTKLLASKPQSIRGLSSLAGNLRRTVAARLRRDFGVRVPPALLRRVIDDAVELAEETGFPNLFFPAVAEEKARFISAALEDDPFEQTTRAFSHAA